MDVGKKVQVGIVCVAQCSVFCSVSCRVWGLWTLARKCKCVLCVLQSVLQCVLQCELQCLGSMDDVKKVQVFIAFVAQCGVCCSVSCSVWGLWTLARECKQCLVCVAECVAV